MAKQVENNLKKKKKKKEEKEEIKKLNSKPAGQRVNRLNNFIYHGDF